MCKGPGAPEGGGQVAVGFRRQPHRPCPGVGGGSHPARGLYTRPAPLDQRLRGTAAVARRVGWGLGKAVDWPSSGPCGT